MVCIFFIISGFVLTTSGLSKIRRRQHSKLLASVSSSILRRMTRIWTPVIAFSLLEVFIIRGYAMAFTHGDVHGAIKIKENVWEQLKDWAWRTLLIVNPLTYPGDWPKYDYAFPVWTLRKQML